LPCDGLVSRTEGAHLSLCLDVPSLNDPGTPIEFTIYITADGTEPSALTYRSSQRYDFAVVDSSGREIWRWSMGKAFAQVMSEETLETGATLRFREVWDQRDNEGREVAGQTYSAVGESLHCSADYQDCGHTLQRTFEILRPL